MQTASRTKVVKINTKKKTGLPDEKKEMGGVNKATIKHVIQVRPT